MPLGPRPEPNKLSANQSQISREDSLHSLSSLNSSPSKFVPNHHNYVHTHTHSTHKLKGPRPIQNSNCSSNSINTIESEHKFNPNSDFSDEINISQLGLQSRDSSSPTHSVKTTTHSIDFIPPPPSLNDSINKPVEQVNVNDTFTPPPPLEIPIELLPFVPSTTPTPTPPPSNIYDLRSVAEWLCQQCQTEVSGIELRDILHDIYTPHNNPKICDQYIDNILEYFESCGLFTPQNLIFRIHKGCLMNINGDLRSLKPSKPKRVFSLKNEDIVSPQPPQVEFPTASDTTDNAGTESSGNGQVELEMNWRKFWNLSETEVSELDKDIVKEQFAIHELIMSEVLFVNDLQLYLDTYGDLTLMKGLTIMQDQELYIQTVFGSIQKVLAVNNSLKNKLQTAQKVQGPFVKCIQTLVTEWATSKHTLDAYLEYANGYLWSERHLRKELVYNTRLRTWFEERSKDPRLNGRPHSFFFNRVLPRLARYHLLLKAIKKYIKEDMIALSIKTDRAIEACNALTLQCDNVIAEQKVINDVQELQDKLIFKSNVQQPKMDLNDPKRRIVFRGDLSRRGDFMMDYIPCVGILLDNYMIIAKNRETQNGSALYVTRPPIPLELMLLECDFNETQTKFVTKLGLALPGAIANATFSEQAVSSADVSTSVSASTASAIPASDASDASTQAVLYPLKLTHLGLKGGKYVLYCSSAHDRQQWVHHITQARESLDKKKAENKVHPFVFQPLTDEFAYPESEMLSLPIPNLETDIYHGLLNKYECLEPLTRVCQRRLVNCIAPIGNCYLLGTDNGLWFLSTEPVYPLRLVLSHPSKILKISVFSYMNAVFILCGDKNLTWYPLDQIIARGVGSQKQTIGVRLNRQRKVQEFHLCEISPAASGATGNTSTGTTKALMYLQNGGIVKILEPLVLYRTLENKYLNQLGITNRKWYIDYFREIDRIQTSQDSSQFHIFRSSAVYTTARHFQWISLNTKRSFILEPIRNSPLAKDRKEFGKPMRIFEFNSHLRILVFETVYFITDLNGSPNSLTITNFIDKCSDCVFIYPFLVLVNHTRELVEIVHVRESDLGLTVQTAVGRDIHFLSMEFMRMAHPWDNNRQLIFKLSLRN